MVSYVLPPPSRPVQRTIVAFQLLWGGGYQGKRISRETDSSKHAMGSSTFVQRGNSITKGSVVGPTNPLKSRSTTVAVLRLRHFSENHLVSFGKGRLLSIRTPAGIPSVRTKGDCRSGGLSNYLPIVP
jgi:hypothetical protein